MEDKNIVFYKKFVKNSSRMLNLISFRGGKRENNFVYVLGFSFSDSYRLFVRFSLSCMILAHLSLVIMPATYCVLKFEEKGFNQMLEAVSFISKLCLFKFLFSNIKVFFSKFI